MAKRGKLCAALLALGLVFSGCGTGSATPDGWSSAIGQASPPAAPAAPSSAPAMPSLQKPSPTPSPTPKPTPSPEQRLLESMTLEEKVGQLFFVRCPEEDGAAMIAQYQPGGVLLFGRDFAGRTREAVVGMIADYRAQAKYGLLIGVDEEGGDVVRVSDQAALAEAPYPAPRALYAEGGVSLLCQTEAEKCRLLASLGINVNFAPVCDISDDPAAFMYSRSLGLSPAETAAVIDGMVRVCETENMGTVLKHFPGYGNAADSHAGIVYDDRAYTAFEGGAFLPFESGMRAGADCVLVAHNIVPCVDGERPASLSADWHDILRGTLGFSGVILTDDLSMGGVTDYANAEAAAVEAVLAGNDMLCCTDYKAQIPAVLRAVENGTIEESRIDESVLRILRWKLERGLLEKISDG